MPQQQLGAPGVDTLAAAQPQALPQPVALGTGVPSVPGDQQVGAGTTPQLQLPAPGGALPSADAVQGTALGTMPAMAPVTAPAFGAPAVGVAPAFGAAAL